MSRFEYIGECITRNRALVMIALPHRISKLGPALVAHEFDALQQCVGPQHAYDKYFLG